MHENPSRGFVAPSSNLIRGGTRLERMEPTRRITAPRNERRFCVLTRKSQGIIAAASMVLFSARMIGPDFKRPAVPIGSKWLESGDRPIDTARNPRSDNQDWWSLFNDPVLTHLIHIAYRQNLDVADCGGASRGSAGPTWYRDR